MDEYQFEEAVANYLESEGYRTQVTSKSKDGGVDIAAFIQDIKIAIQCKFYSHQNKVSSPEVQQVSGLLADPEFDHAVLVTSSSFTNEARKIAQQRGVQILKADLQVTIPELNLPDQINLENQGEVAYDSMTDREENIQGLIDKHLSNIEGNSFEIIRIEFDYGRYLVHGNRHEIKHESANEVAKIVLTAEKYGWAYISTVNKEGQNLHPREKPRITFKPGRFNPPDSEKSAKILSLICERVFDVKISKDAIIRSDKRPADAFNTSQIIGKTL